MTRTHGARRQQVTALGALALLAAAAVISPHSAIGMRAIPAVIAFLWAAAALVSPGPGAAIAVLSDLTRGLSRVDRRVLVLGAIAFVLLNASCEEWIWRGILQRRLAAILPAQLAVTIQAAHVVADATIATLVVLRMH